MPDFENFVAVAEKLLRGRYGSWLNQPEEMALCTLDDSCNPLIWTAPYELRKATVKWSRVPSAGIPQDAAMCTFHFLNLTDGDPDDTWTADDFGVAEGLLGTFWQDFNTWYRDDVVLSEIVWTKDGPAFTPFGALPHPTVRAISLDLPGTFTGTAPTLTPQTAITVTEVTSAKYTVSDVEGVGDQVRNRWGRFYLPPPAASAMAAGRIADATCEDIADAAQTLYDSAADSDLPIVMYSPTTGSSWSVDAIHVDDIFDVIRSRRFETPISRHSRSVPI